MTESAESILAIPVGSPFRLFPRDVDKRKEKFKALAKAWHPDHGGRTDVFAHISALHEAAENGVEENALILHAKNGKTYRTVAKRMHRFELGTTIVCETVAAFMVEHKYDDLVLNGVRQIGAIRYPDDRMKEQHAKFIPVIVKMIDTETHDVVVVEKTKDVFLLRDVLAHFNGKMDPKHVAWIVSSLLNITCFYELIKLTHNGLSIDNVFVSPEHHTAFPLSFWYAQQRGKTLTHLPPSSHMLAPRSLLTSKKADHRLDLECIRGIARKCVGSDLSILPRPYADFLRWPAPTSPVADYENWVRVLVDSWGKRRYLKLSITANDIYS